MTRPILYIAGPYSPGNGRSTEDNLVAPDRHKASQRR